MPTKGSEMTVQKSKTMYDLESGKPMESGSNRWKTQRRLSPSAELCKTIRDDDLDVSSSSPSQMTSLSSKGHGRRIFFSTILNKLAPPAMSVLFFSSEDV
ncbi:hypothetical protein CHARACLAT_008624 [Characodon lateralis]|uniref:Uncharacterized protein n=1 Tax=Characodon lateralis TaxID=208331 RepID=A0ABU7E889_9TELE|nr:hypothetical protein [Characodon lateralis]